MKESLSLGGVGETPLRIMEKKEYIVPVCEVIELETLSMLAGSPNKDFEGEEGDIELQTNRYRGEWGNLWNDGK
jgi:hypothetical protein